MLKRISLQLRIGLALMTIAMGLLINPLFSGVQALNFPNRSILVSTAVVSANTIHDFQFTVPTTSAIGSIKFEYCTNSPIITASCTAPAGMDADAANLITQTGNIGFTIHAPTTNANRIVLSRSPAAAIAVPSRYVFDNIINPSTANQTTYVRISSYITANGSGAVTDDGGVAFATVSPFSINTFVPPFLQICVAITVTLNCSSSSGNSLDLGILSSQSTKSGTSQFSTGTNSTSGYSVFIIGTTMTSGNNSIPAMNPAGSSQTGTSQFGVNLRANTTPAVGLEPQGSGTGSPQAGYNTVNQFKLQSGDLIASSPLPTDYNQMTVSYVVNVTSDQAPGIYNTTLSYLASAQF